MKLTPVAIVAALVAAAPVLIAQRPPLKVANPVVVQFMVDGIDHNSVRTAVASGATTLGTLLKEGTTAATYYCTSPAPRLDLPDGSRPWGGSTWFSTSSIDSTWL